MLLIGLSIIKKVTLLLSCVSQNKVKKLGADWKVLKIILPVGVALGRPGLVSGSDLLDLMGVMAL